MAGGALLIRRLRALFDVQSRLAGLDHAPANRLDRVGHLWYDLAHCAPQVLFHRASVDLRQTLVDAEVLQIGVHETEADRGRGVDRLDVRQLAARLLLALAQRFFGPLALGDVMDDRDKTWFATKLNRLDRDPGYKRFARFPFYRHLEVANVTLLFQNRAHMPAVRGIDREVKVSPAFSDHFIAPITEHLAPAIIDLENDAVGLAGDDETVRTCAERFGETLLALAQRFLGPLALGNVAGDREPTMFAAKFERLGRERDQTRFAGFPLHHEFKVADVISLFQNRQHAPAVRGIDIESEVNRAFSDHLIPVIAGQRDEAIVSFKNGAVSEAGNDEGVRACEEGFSESLLALAQRFLGLDRFSGDERARDGILFRPVRTDVLAQGAVLRVSSVVVREQHRMAPQRFRFAVAENRTARRRLGNGHADGHLFKNLPQTITLGLDLPVQALALGLLPLSPADVVNDELREMPPLPLEPHGADLRRKNLAVIAPERDFDLPLRHVAGKQTGQTIAELIHAFGRKEVEEAPSYHLLWRDSEHPLHRLVGQMDRPVVAGDHNAVRRDFGEQPVPLFARAQRLFGLDAVGDVAHRAGYQNRLSAFVVKLLALVEDVNIGAVGAAESVFVEPVAVGAPYELFKTGLDSPHVFGMNAVKPVLQSGLQISGAGPEQRPRPFAPPQLVRLQIDLPDRILSGFGDAPQP